MWSSWYETTSYQLQIAQLPIPVTPVTHSSYFSYQPRLCWGLVLLYHDSLTTVLGIKELYWQLPTPVTHSGYSRYPLQLPQLFKLLQLHQLPNSPPPLHFPPQVHLGPDQGGFIVYKVRKMGSKSMTVLGLIFNKISYLYKVKKIVNCLQ